MQTTINGIEVFLKGDPKAQPIVFVHGFPFDHTLWDEVIEQLHHEYYCISYDMRGFGASAVECGQYTMESYVDDLEAIIKQLELQDVIVCGFSIGGYITFRANERMQNFKALILANTTTTADNDEAKLNRAQAIKTIEQAGVSAFLDQFFPNVLTQNYRDNNPQQMLHWRQKIEGFDPIGIKGGLLAMICRTDTTSSLDKTPPSLLIAADEDAIIPAQGMKEIAAKMNNAQYKQIHGSSHVTILEKPKEFIENVQEFLAQIK